MVELLWALAAGVVTFGLALAGRDVLRAPALQRVNYAGREVPTAGGVFAVLGFMAVAAVATTVDRVQYDVAWRMAWMVGAFALLGLFDDVVGTAAARGLRGHVNAARRGQLTSGLIKLVFGVGIAWLAISPAPTSLRIAGTIVIAGSANVANLLDLAPARAVKGAFLTFVVVAFVANQLVEGGAYWFLFAAVALTPFELREKLMLGDTGANPLGAVVGFLVAGTLQESTRAVWMAAAVVVAINVAAEFVSFSRIIDRVPPLRALDRLGRLR